MIQPNELRIGNWAVNYGQYVCIEADDIVDCYHSPESYDPILLTPEILKKIGFKCADHTYMGGVVYYLKNIQWVYREKGVCFVMVNGFPLSHIFYLHQLQNLYFALTGEELEIDL